MNILVIGGSRGIGLQTVKAGLEQGHSVTAFARNTAVINIKHPKLRLQQGDVLDASSVEQALKGQDAVVCALGLPTLKAIGPPLAKRSYVLSKGTENILKTMTLGPGKRFICVTAIGTGDSAEQCTLFARLVLRTGLRWLFKEKDHQEQLIKKSNLDWTIIRPTALTNGRKKDAVTTESLHAGILTQVSRVDVAAAILNIIPQAATYKRALIISCPPRFGDSARWIAGYFGLG